MRDSQRLRVVSLALYKQRNSSQHEYIILVVVDRDSDREYHFLIERRAPAGGQLSRPSSTSSLSLPEASTVHSSSGSAPSLRTQNSGNPSANATVTTRLSAASSKDMPAVDSIEWLPNGKTGNKDDVQLGVLSFSTDQASPTSVLYLYDIVILVNTLHDEYPTYTHPNRNCYFMAGTIIDVICWMCNVDMKLNPSTPHDLKQGSWHIIAHTYHLDKDKPSPHTEKLKTLYEKAALRFQENISEQEEQGAHLDRKLVALKAETAALEEKLKAERVAAEEQLKAEIVAAEEQLKVERAAVQKLKAAIAAEEQLKAEILAAEEQLRAERVAAEEQLKEKLKELEEQLKKMEARVGAQNRAEPKPVSG